MFISNSIEKNNKLILFVFSFYLIALAFFSLRSEVLYWSNLSFYEFIIKSTNLIPFKTISAYIQSFFTQSVNLDIALRNLILPIIAFVPFGLLGYRLTGGKGKFLQTLLGCAAFCFILEVLQPLLRRGSFDVDDIILSVIGAFCGMLVFFVASKIKLWATKAAGK